MFMMVTTVFLFTFSCVLNRQCIHNLFKNQMITNHAIQLNVCNSQCSLGTCLLSLAHPHGTWLSLLQCSLETWLSPAPPWDLLSFWQCSLGTWLSLFKCVLTRHGERIGYLCHRCLTQLNLPTSR